MRRELIPPKITSALAKNVDHHFQVNASTPTRLASRVLVDLRNLVFGLFMLSAVAGLPTAIPEVVLFVSPAIGYGLRQVKNGQIQLGGVCWTRIATLAIRLVGVMSDAHLKKIFSALFIFAPGFAGAPQFISHSNAKDMRRGAYGIEAKRR